MFRRVLALPFTALLVACPPGDGAALSENSSTGSPNTTTSTSTTGTSTTDAVTTGAPTAGSTEQATTEDSSTGTSGTTGGPTPESVCDPQPEAVSADFSIDGRSGFQSIDYVHHCAVASLSQDIYLLLELSGCKSDPDDAMEEPVTHVIEAEVAPADPIDLEVGDAVVLAHFVVEDWFRNRSFTLRRPTNELVLAGLEGPDFAGMPIGPPAGFFEPFTMTSREVCPYEPLPPAEETNFLGGGEECYQLRRDAVRLTWSQGATVDLIDRSSAKWPDQPYRVTVAAAEHHMDLGQCTDQIGRWFRLMILRSKS